MEIGWSPKEGHPYYSVAVIRLLSHSVSTSYALDKTIIRRQALITHLVNIDRPVLHHIITGTFWGPLLGAPSL